MKLETVGAVTMCGFGFKVGRQVDDVDRLERAFLGTLKPE